MVCSFLLAVPAPTPTGRLPHFSLPSVFQKAFPELHGFRTAWHRKEGPRNPPPVSGSVLRLAGFLEPQPPPFAPRSLVGFTQNRAARVWSRLPAQACNSPSSASGLREIRGLLFRPVVNLNSAHVACYKMRDIIIGAGQAYSDGDKWCLFDFLKIRK